MSSLSVGEQPAMKNREAYRRYTTFESNIVDRLRVSCKFPQYGVTCCKDAISSRWRVSHLYIPESCTYECDARERAERHLWLFWPSLWEKVWWTIWPAAGGNKMSNRRVELGVGDDKNVPLFLVWTTELGSCKESAVSWLKKLLWISGCLLDCHRRTYRWWSG